MRRLRGGEIIVVYKVRTAAVGLVDQRKNPVGGAIALHLGRPGEHHDYGKNDPGLNKMLGTR